MTELQFTSEMPVALIDWMGADVSFVTAARVSFAQDLVDMADCAPLINFLVKNRHGSPFEHAVMKWRIEAPIFVWREFHRHRIASYNEMSGRYTQLPPKFYVPPNDRPLVQVGKPGAYTFIPGDWAQQMETGTRLAQSYQQAYVTYETLLEQGIAKEVARDCLPVAIFSTCYVTMNIRALTNFLSLRTKSDTALFPSYPQWEIEQVANAMEETFAERFPITAEAWQKNGRVPL